MAQNANRNTSTQPAANNAVAPAVATATAPVRDSAIDDFANLQHVKPSIGLRSSNGSLSMNIVRSDGNGKRVKFSNRLHEELGSPTSIQVAYSGNRLFVGETIPDATQTYAFSKGKGKTILYRSDLVQWLIDTFNLTAHFEAHVSLSFGNITVKSKEIDGETITYAVIVME